MFSAQCRHYRGRLGQELCAGAHAVHACEVLYSTSAGVLGGSSAVHVARLLAAAHGRRTSDVLVPDVTGMLVKGYGSFLSAMLRSGSDIWTGFVKYVKLRLAILLRLSKSGCD